MITTIHTQETPSRTPQAERALAQLQSELLGIERGEEPNHHRIQRALLELSDRPPSRRAPVVRDLCERLCRYLRDIGRDDMELSVEDLDVLLDNWTQLAQLVLDLDMPATARAAVNPPGPVSAETKYEVNSAPEFRDSGLLVESSRDTVRILPPAMEDPRVTAKVFADISELWELTAGHGDWVIELRKLERVPVSLLALLVRLRGEGHGGARTVELRGLAPVHSPLLAECLGRCFRVAEPEHLIAPLDRP